MKKLNNKKVVIWAANGLGDITMIFPIINYFKREGYYVTLIGIHKRYLNFLEAWNMIDDYIIFEYKSNQSKLFWAKERVKLIRKVKLKAPDIMIIANKQSLFNHKAFKHVFGVNKYAFVKNYTVTNQSNINNMILGRLFNYKVKEKDYYYCNKLINSLKRSKLVMEDINYICINPFSKKSNTLIKPKYFMSLLNPNKTYFVIGSEDNKMSNYIRNNVYNRLSNNFYKSLKILYCGKYLITGDGGVMHFNLALGKKTVSYWKESRPRPQQILRNTKLSKEIILDNKHFQ